MGMNVHSTASTVGSSEGSMNTGSREARATDGAITALCRAIVHSVRDSWGTTRGKLRLIVTWGGAVGGVVTFWMQTPTFAALLKMSDSEALLWSAFAIDVVVVPGLMFLLMAEVLSLEDYKHALSSVHEEFRRRERDLVEERERESRFGRLKDEASHMLFEAVRAGVYSPTTCPEQPFASLEHFPRTTELLNRVAEELRHMLGVERVAATVKLLEGQATDRKIRAVLRVNHARGVTRVEVTKSSKSYVMDRFEHSDQSERQVYVGDIETLPDQEGLSQDVRKSLREYVEYGKGCGFRSVLAFPLRTPALQGNKVTSMRSVIGFLSFDCATPCAFSPLVEDLREDGTPSLDFFYGLADGLATLVLLCDNPAEPKEDRVKAAAG